VETWDDFKKRVLQDRNRYFHVLNFFEDYPVLELRIAGDSALVRGASDREWLYTISNNPREFEDLIATLSEADRSFAAVEDWMLPILTQNRKAEWMLSTYQHCLPEEVSLPETDIFITELAPQDAAVMYENSEYKEFLTNDYIQDRIQRGIGAAVRVEGQLVAWILTQDDGAMGFLHVLHPYRKNGYARALTIHLSRLLRRQQKLPFACVKETNTPAISLLQRLGFEKGKRVHWLELARQSGL